MPLSPPLRDPGLSPPFAVRIVCARSSQSVFARWTGRQEICERTGKAHLRFRCECGDELTIKVW